MSFKACRVCCVLDSAAEMSSLFDGDGESAQQLEIISGIDILQDRGKFEALICDRCLENLNAAFWLRENTRNAERHCYELLRDIVTEKEEDQMSEKTNEAAEVKVEVSLVVGQDLRIKEERSIESFELESNDGYQTDEEMEKESEVEVERKSVQVEEEGQAGTSGDGKKQTSKEADDTKCKICGKILSTIRGLKQHIKCVHEKITRFNCPHCEMKFYQKSGLTRHVARRHQFINDGTWNSNRPFRCETCEKFFKTKYDLKSHQKSHLNQKKK